MANRIVPIPRQVKKLEGAPSYPLFLTSYRFPDVAQFGRALALGERCDRRRWRSKGAERVAAVGEERRHFNAEDIRRVPQQEPHHLIPYF